MVRGGRVSGVSGHDTAKGDDWSGKVPAGREGK